jgi:squalene-hopene/tetraprenyl-beta-curcumene cyclase
MRVSDRQMRVAVMCLVVVFCGGCSGPQPKIRNAWNPRAAAAYLDQRENWWSGWPGAARDHQTFCVSCHTAVPYALSRPVLRAALSEQGPSPEELKLVQNVIQRVRLWNEVGPFYTDQGYGRDKAAQSRGTEAVLNALILANYDSRDGHLSDDTRAAFRNMWKLQQTAGPSEGAWSWLQFRLEPWEAADSEYYGAALAAIAVGTAPEDYPSSPEIQNNLALLRGYLKRKYPTESTANRAVLLWAATRLPGLLDSEQEKSLIAEILSDQQADGGWRLSPLVWTRTGWNPFPLISRWIRSDGTPQKTNSDPYATALITLVLEQAGIPRDNPQLQRARVWLMSDQNPTEGDWPSYSVNKHRKWSSNTGRFMSDAATAYSVLALASGGSQTPPADTAVSRLLQKKRYTETER